MTPVTPQAHTSSNGSPFNTSSITPSSLPATPSPISQNSPPNSYDSKTHHSDLSSSNTPSSPSASHQASDEPAIQICLQGPTLREAWLANEVTRSLSFMPPRNWNPSLPAGYYVYHGTSLPDEGHDRAEDLVNNGLLLEHAAPFNELSPRAAVYTSYSAIRSFLWSVFSNDFAEITITARQGTTLKRGWDINGHHYEGVLLLQFSLPVPSRDDCQQVVLNEHQTEQWCAAISQPRGQTADQRWNRERSIHGSPLDRLPDLLHAPERLLTERAFRSWMGRGLLRLPLWRTAATTLAGVSHINNHRTAVFAISCEQPAVSGGGEPRTRRQKAFRASTNKLQTFWARLGSSPAKLWYICLTQAIAYGSLKIF